MSFSELGLPAPDHHLDVGSGTHAAQTAAMMIALEPVLVAERPDWVVVWRHQLDARGCRGGRKT
jgi:UDP-N-acetylglucosamine 2-epimerase (non-hydrolysing)